MNDDNERIFNEVSGFLHDIISPLSAFLGSILPVLGSDWWKVAVVNSLSYQQSKRLEQRNIKTLSGLDLAGLLRVLDQNWHHISENLNLPPESRHYVKEMTTIRNRWAHVVADGFKPDDVYRDLDTLQRFAQVIQSESHLLKRINEAKKDIIANNFEFLKIDNNRVEPEQSEIENTDFLPGQIVYAKTNPEIHGAVVSIITGGVEKRVQVFIDGSVQTFYSSQLLPVASETQTVDISTIEHLHAYLSAIQINNPSLTNLFSLNAARIDFIPYQFRPVLRLIRSDRPRLLIADGVGVGKTIEAGLILRELQSRRDIKSVLIICPRPLVIEKKWQIEMKRFEERFVNLDGNTLRYCISEMDLEGSWPDQYQKVILPYSLLDDTLLYGSSQSGKNQRKGLLELDPPPRFDLVIVDEAHHIRNPETLVHKSVRFFCDNAEAVIFLTATPIQLGNNDLYVLLHMLRPDLIIDQQSFNHMAEPNPFINKALSLIRAQDFDWQKKAVRALDEAVCTSWGESVFRRNPNYNRVRKQLSNDLITQEDRIALISKIEDFHSFSGIINRTRRRDIGSFTIRKPKTINIPFTAEQQIIHDEIIRIQTTVFHQLYNTDNIQFMLTTLRRQAASCLFGLAPFVKDILNRHLDELIWDEADDSEGPLLDGINPIIKEIQSLNDRLNTLHMYDPKLEALQAILHDKMELENNKVMLFSSFRHTLVYLYKKLKSDGFRVGLVHGGTPDEERNGMRVLFEKQKSDSDAIDVLLFSEIGCEGLDYQFCDCIINYDLPWNPMRIEQRIGRIDRNGQKSETISIINFVTPGTVDADIYEKCLMRIGVFNTSIGDCEEILGEISREIKDIAENYTLSVNERNTKLQQLSDNQIRLIQEQELLEEKQVEFFGIKLTHDNLVKDVENSSSYWLNSESIQRLVLSYLRALCGQDKEYILGDNPVKTLRLNQDDRGRLLNDYKLLPRQANTWCREWENWLKESKPHLLITFDAERAKERNDAVLLMLQHPLVKQAANSYKSSGKLHVNLSVNTNDIPSGVFPFVIYHWVFKGITDDHVLRPISSDPLVTEKLTDLIKKSYDSPEINESTFNSKLWDAIDDEHYRLWDKEKTEHKEKVNEIVNFKKESLKGSHSARVLLLNDQLCQAKNAKIKRMRQVQLSNAETDYALRIQELEIASERADIFSNIVAYGCIKIKKKAMNE